MTPTTLSAPVALLASVVVLGWCAFGFRAGLLGAVVFATSFGPWLALHGGSFSPLTGALLSLAPWLLFLPGALARLRLETRAGVCVVAALACAAVIGSASGLRIAPLGLLLLPSVALPVGRLWSVSLDEEEPSSHHDVIGLPFVLTSIALPVCALLLQKELLNALGASSESGTCFRSCTLFLSNLLAVLAFLRSVGLRLGGLAAVSLAAVSIAAACLPPRAASPLARRPVPTPHRGGPPTFALPPSGARGSIGR